MGGKKRSKRKKSSENENLQSQRKSVKYGDSPQGDCNTIGNSVSEILSQANSVLYDNDQLSPTDMDSLENSVFESPSSSGNMASYASTVKDVHSTGMPLQGPSNADLMECLKQINLKLEHVDNRLKTLDVVERKVDKFDIELKKLWTFVHDKNKAADERISKVESMTESAQFSVGLAQDKIARLEKEKSDMKDELNYLQSQSMRNNLMFSNIPEDINETNERTEAIVRHFIVDKLKIAHDLVKDMQFERVHRIGQPRADGKIRQIIAKFTLFKDREAVRKERKNLKDTNFFISEQFPKAIVERRKKLLPKLKKAKEENHDAWISYDTLYIDGVAVKSTP